ncbi:hypothetical protein C8T65DRAFT_48430 [Cerioporus squamosus]|nr:hypothetical protein C8T65DRAFT_48430 [Cerioporus squamosus]
MLGRCPVSWQELAHQSPTPDERGVRHRYACLRDPSESVLCSQYAATEINLGAAPVSPRSRHHSQGASQTLAATFAAAACPSLRLGVVRACRHESPLAVVPGEVVQGHSRPVGMSPYDRDLHIAAVRPSVLWGFILRALRTSSRDSPGSCDLHLQLSQRMHKDRSCLKNTDIRPSAVSHFIRPSHVRTPSRSFGPPDHVVLHPYSHVHYLICHCRSFGHHPNGFGLPA